MGYRLYKHINIHGAARRDAARPEQTAQGEGERERGGGDGRALSAPADTDAQRHVPVLPPRARGDGSAGAEGRGPADRWLRPPPRGAAPYLRPARPLRRRPAPGRESRRLRASRAPSAILRRAARGATGSLSRGEPRPAPRASHLVPQRRKGRPAAPGTESSHRGSGSCIPAGRCCCGGRAARPPAPTEPPSAHHRTGGSFWGSSALLALFPPGSITACQRSLLRLRGAGGEGALQSGSAGSMSLRAFLSSGTFFPIFGSLPSQAPSTGPDPRERGARVGTGAEPPQRGAVKRKQINN